MKKFKPLQNVLNAVHKNLVVYFFNIPIDHVIPDILHLFLRVTDILINLLILELRRLDGIEKCKLTSLDRSRVTHIAKCEQCKICFKIFNSDSKALQWRDLTGPEKLKLFSTINIPSLFPDIPDAQKVQMLSTNFIGCLYLATQK